MFSKNKVFEQMKKTGFVGAGINAGRGKGKRHRWDLSKLKAKAPEPDEPEMLDSPEEEAAEPEMPKSGVHLSVHLPDSLMGELRKLNPKRIGRVK